MLASEGEDWRIVGRKGDWSLYRDPVFVHELLPLPSPTPQVRAHAFGSKTSTFILSALTPFSFTTFSVEFSFLSFM
jgi:hypothetical protein